MGVVKQTETSAIKASGTNRNTLFTRQLSALYTKSTLVGEGILLDGTRVCFSESEVGSLTVVFLDVNSVVRLDDVKEGGCADVVPDPPGSFLLCISENWDKLRRQLTVGLVVSLFGGGVAVRVAE